MRLQILAICGFVLLITQVNCGTITRTETFTNPNAGAITSTWSGQNFATMQPSREIKVIGGTSVNAEAIQRDPSNARGMDVEALLELFRTKQPVERITTDAEGNKRTTTYSLQENGAVKSETVTDVKPTIISSSFNGWPFDGNLPGLDSRWNFEKPETQTIVTTKKWPNIEERRVTSVLPHSGWNFEDALNERKQSPLEATTTKESEWPKFEDRVTSMRPPYVWNYENFLNELKNTAIERTTMPSLSENTWTKIEERVKTVPPLPSLDEFFKQQNSTPPTVTLQLENFPIAGTYEPGKTIDEQLLQNASILKPQPMNSRENDVEIFSSVAQPTVGNTKVTTITRTYTLNSSPTLFDLGPSILRKNPDGTTSILRGNRIPETSLGNKDNLQPVRAAYEPMQYPVPSSTARTPTSTSTPAPTSTPPPTTSSSPAEIENPIDAFLAKLDLSTDDIVLENGLLVKRIIDSAGRILTVDFTLSTVKQKNDEQGQSPMK